MKTVQKLYDLIWKGDEQREADALCSRIQEALELTDNEGRLLDMGCGNGVFLLSLEKGKSTFGVDISTTALRIAVSKDLKVVKVDFNTGNIPFKDDSFDSINCLDVIEHVFEPEELIREANRILRKGGIFIISTPNIRFIEYLSLLFLGGYFPKTSYDHYSYDGGHIHYFTFADIRKLLEKNGFTIIEEKGIAHRPYRSIKMFIFRIIAKVWEKQVEKEFFHRGIIVKSRKIAV